ncbi:hypothetical protein HA402_010353 [Bradysia odoriphaga]|nr:hypothetical protein HA402_010353 [Bradysia odoriphaga]
MMNNGLFQMSSYKNNSGNVLDLIYTNSPELTVVSKADYRMLPLHKSDVCHVPLTCAIEFDPIVSTNSMNADDQQEVYSFRKANYDDIRAYLSTFDFPSILNNATHIDDMLHQFYNILQDAFIRFVPKSKIRSTNKPRWHDKSLASLKNKRNKEHKKLSKMRRKTTDVNEEPFLEALSNFEKYRKELYEKYIQQQAANLTRNPKDFWKHLNGKRKSNSLPDTMNYNNETARTDQEKADLFADYFEDVYAKHEDDQSLDSFILNRNDENCHDFTISREHVESTLRKMDINKGCGFDGVASIFLRECASELTDPLTTIFSTSLTQILPNWITQTNRKNVVRGNGVHTLSGLNAKNLNEKAKKVINFDEMVTTRREQAQRSILVQVQSQKSFTDLQKYCSQFGKIIGGHHYVLADRQFILIEFSSHLEAQKAIACSTFEDATGFCVQSPFLWFRAAQSGSVAKDTNDTKNVSGKLMVSDGCRPVDYNKINQVMLGAASLSDQIGILCRSTMLDDLGVRMRFLAARQIEESISSIFPSVRACIFGSSVNGYGKLGCDLDLILHFHSLDCYIDTTKRLVFHTKKLSSIDSRSDLQKNLVIVSGIVQRFLPGISNVRTILPARVPIIKYHHDLLDLEVDVSLNNMSGVYMSELLYMFTQIDDRVQPLVYTIRRWAQTSGVTRPSPGFWISNFSLTCLVIFYLQQLSKPVLPTINSLIQQARPQDKRLSDEEAPPCTFLRDLNVLKFPKENTDSLSELLAGFFEYYSQMNFADKAISLNDAQLLTKPNNAAVYMINPLDPSLNVTKNMSIDERERFCTEARNAAWFLASTDTTTTKRDPNDPWGLLNLLRDPGKAVIRPTMFFKSRMVELESIFGKDSADAVNENVYFKNGHVKKEIANIQKKKKSELTKMKAGRSKR